MEKRTKKIRVTSEMITEYRELSHRARFCPVAAAELIVFEETDLGDAVWSASISGDAGLYECS